MFCQKCGTENKDGAAFCNSCGTALKGPVPQTIGATSTETPNVKHQSIIKAKIATKEEQIGNISSLGPGLVIVLGILICLSIVGIILGLIFIGFGIWWSSSRENEKKRLQNEIRELELELNPEQPTHNEVIKAKIAKKEEEIRDLLFFHSSDEDKKKLQNEIKELEAELE